MPCSAQRLRAVSAAALIALALFVENASSLEPLSLEAAQRAAVARSRELTGMEAAAHAARETSVAAGRLPDPMLMLGLENVPIDGGDRFSLTAEPMTMGRVGLAQTFTRQAKRSAAANRYLREAEKLSAQRQAAIARIQRQATLAWLDRHFAERTLTALDEQRAAVNQEIKAVEGAYRAGRATQADVIGAHAALAELEDRRAEQLQQIATSNVALRRWVGDLAQRPLSAPPPLDTLPLDAASLRKMLHQHPELLALRKEQEMAMADAELARANRKSDWTVGVNYEQRGPDYSNMVSVGISIPLQWDQRRRQDRELAAKLKQLDDARAQREEAERDHAAVIEALLTDWRSLRARGDRFRTDLLPLARERTRATLAAFAGGKASLVDLTSARRAEIDTQLRALDLDARAARVWAQLRTLTPVEDHDGRSAQ